MAGSSRISDSTRDPDSMVRKGGGLGNCRVTARPIILSGRIRPGNGGIRSASRANGGTSAPTTRSRRKRRRQVGTRANPTGYSVEWRPSFPGPVPFGEAPRRPGPWWAFRSWRGRAESAHPCCACLARHFDSSWRSEIGIHTSAVPAALTQVMPQRGSVLPAECPSAPSIFRVLSGRR